MNENPYEAPRSIQTAQKSNRGSWITAAAVWARAMVIGVVAFLVAASLQGVAMMLLAPELAGDPSVISRVFGVAIWLVAIGVGVCLVARYRPKR